MDVNEASILNLFEKKMQLEVPLFQRQYTWGKEQQWIPLWEDISRKFTESLQETINAPEHFLGAMVLDQKQTPATHVEKHQIIDGQQRLTTLQIFLAALRDWCQERACRELSEECNSFLQNTGMMKDPNVDVYKVWPTRFDRQCFSDVISSKSKQELERRHPPHRKKYARKNDQRPLIIEAYLFFYEEFTSFFIGTLDNPPAQADVELPTRIEKCLHALRNSLKVVVIGLENNDDAQVIFETLNSRGAPLLPADLLRNYIFLRASRDNISQDDQENLYQKFWEHFDDDFWRKKAGRQGRTHSDLFLQHFLTSKRGTETSARHLYVEYKSWAEGSPAPYTSVQDELEAIANARSNFYRLVKPQEGDVVQSIATFMENFDISTPYSLLLHLFDADTSNDEWKEVSAILESYFLRRAVCGVPTQGQNKTFAQLTNFMHDHAEGSAAENIRSWLKRQTTNSARWPRDEEFEKAWMVEGSYEPRSSFRLVYILTELNNTYMSAKSEHPTFSKPFTIEHIMPQGWREHWPLPDGHSALSHEEAADSDSPSARATRERDTLIHTFGNLTILTQALNTTASNYPWTDSDPKKSKRELLLEHSVLPITLQWCQVNNWNEDTIKKRGQDLFERALELWPSP